VFLLQVEFSTLMFERTSKIQSDECLTSLIRFVLVGRTDLMKPIFVSINFAIAPKMYIHKTSYTASLQKNL